METFDLDVLLSKMESEEAPNCGMPVTEAPPWFLEALVRIFVRLN
jgi:hypothetical protein